MPSFDVYGNLIPFGINEYDYEFLSTFTYNEKREEIFDQYTSYLDNLKNLCDGAEILHWIDGSFASQEEEPRDIDIVLFIDYQTIEKLSGAIASFKQPLSRERYNLIDCYIVTIYPEDHKNHQLFISDKLYWLHLFEKSKPNRTGKRHPKGFLELIY